MQLEIRTRRARPFRQHRPQPWKAGAALPGGRLEGISTVVLSAASPGLPSVQALSLVLRDHFRDAGHTDVRTFELATTKLAPCQGEFDCCSRRLASAARSSACCRRSSGSGPRWPITTRAPIARRASSRSAGRPRPPPACRPRGTRSPTPMPCTCCRRVSVPRYSTTRLGPTGPPLSVVCSRPPRRQGGGHGAAGRCRRSLGPWSRPPDVDAFPGLAARIPAEAIERMATAPMPDAVSRFMGDVGWRYQAHENGLAPAALRARPLD